SARAERREAGAGPCPGGLDELLGVAGGGGATAWNANVDLEPMQPVVIGDVVWTPSPEVIERARLTRFMARHGIGDFDQLLKRSVDDPEWFWDAVIHDLGVSFYRHYDRVLDESEGPEWPKWFGGGKL